MPDDFFGSFVGLLLADFMGLASDLEDLSPAGFVGSLDDWLFIGWLLDASGATVSDSIFTSFYYFMLFLLGSS